MNNMASVSLAVFPTYGIAGSRFRDFGHCRTGKGSPIAQPVTEEESYRLGVIRRVAERKRGHNAWIDFAGRFDRSFTGCPAFVALQPGMGLLSERAIWSDPRHHRYLAVARTLLSPQKKNR
jgi:hypothetical protein